MRLKDVVIDLEFKLRDANQRACNLDSLKDVVTSQFSELNKSLRGGVSLDQSMMLDVTGPVGDGELLGVQGEYESQILANAMSPEPPIVSDQLIPEPGEWLF